MDILETFQAVNKTRTTRDLVYLVQEIAKAGLLTEHDLDFTLESIQDYPKHPAYYANNITRKFGIRQQTMMLNFYNK